MDEVLEWLKKRMAEYAQEARESPGFDSIIPITQAMAFGEVIKFIQKKQ